jgi:MFS family permease
MVWEPLLRVAILFTFSLRQLTFGTAIGIAFGVLIAATLALENIDWKRRRVIVRERDTFLLLTILAVVLFLAAPLSVEEGFVLKARLLLFPYLICLPWLSPRLPRVLLVTVFAVVALVNVYYMRECWKRSAKDLAIATAPLPGAVSHRTIIALNFDRSSPYSRLPLFSHTVSYGFTEQRLIDLGNYEAALGFFPVAFRAGVRRPPILDIEMHPGDFNPDAYADVVDYIYVWKMPAGAPLESRLDAHYTLVVDGGDAKVYGRK